MTQFDKQTLQALEGDKQTARCLGATKAPHRRAVELAKCLEVEHKASTQEAAELRQRLHEVELIRTGCQAALAAMKEQQADDPQNVRPPLGGGRIPSD